MYFENCVEYFAESVQSKVIKSEQEGILRVNVKNIELVFAYVEYRSCIVVHAELDMHNGSKEALQCLLEMNNLYSKTQGICLGINKNIITAQQNIYIDANAVELLVKELFLEQCQLFCTSVLDVLNEIYSNQALGVKVIVSPDPMLKD